MQLEVRKIRRSPRQPIEQENSELSRFTGGLGESKKLNVLFFIPLRVAKAGSNHFNEEITPLLPTGIGERSSQTI